MNDKKILTPKEVAALLGLPYITIQRWEHQGKIPFKIINHEKCYREKEILEWARRHDLPVKQVKSVSKKTATGILSAAINRGGIYDDLNGKDVYTVLENALKQLDFVSFTDREMVFNELLNREELASTGIGKGIAIPHTRNRLDLGLEETRVAVFFLKNPIDYNSIDSAPVRVLFMIFTPNTRVHLKILSRISFLLQNDQLLDVLNQQNRNNDLISVITEIEDAG